jgi:hypothetical protein
MWSCDVIQADGSLLKLPMNILPLSSGRKSETSMEKVVRTRIGALSKGALKGLNYFIILLAQSSNPSLMDISFSIFDFIINTEYVGSPPIMSVNIYKTTQCHIPEYRILHIHCHKDVKSDVLFFNFAKWWILSLHIIILSFYEIN